MANQISVTVVNINGSPLQVSETMSFLTSNTIITAETTSNSPTANAKIYYFDSPFQQKTYYITEEVSDVVTAANTDGTSQVALTCYSINGYGQRQALDISVPASGFATQTVSDSPINTIVSFMKLTFGVSETESDIVTAANAGGGGGGGSTLFALTGSNTATGNVTGDLDGSDLLITDDNISVTFTNNGFSSIVDDLTTEKTLISNTSSVVDLTWSNNAETEINRVRINEDGGLVTLAAGAIFRVDGAFAGGVASRTITGTTGTLANTDKGLVIYFTNNSDITFTVPAGLDTDMNTAVVQLGTGKIIFTEDTTNIINVDSYTQTKGVGSIATIIGTPTADTFVTSGAMEA